MNQKIEDIMKCIEGLREQLERHRKTNLKEYPTRTIFIDPMLYCLGWDVRDPDEVQLEYPTIDGRSVDYAPKLNRKAVLFIEAKSIVDSLEDVKAITQVVGYAANAGVKWCILTNGLVYKVYQSTANAPAPDKILFEVSIDPKDAGDRSLRQIAELFYRFSNLSMRDGTLDKIGEQIFVRSKIRRSLDKLFADPPKNLIKIIRQTIDDDTIKPSQIESALNVLWASSSEVEIPEVPSIVNTVPTSLKKAIKKGTDYPESHHLKDRPQEVIELYKTLDKYSRELNPGNIIKKYAAKTINYMLGKKVFCSIHIYKSGLRVWVKLNYVQLDNPPENVRDVSNVGHWGAGDVEIAVNSIDDIDIAKKYIRESLVIVGKQ